MIPVGHKSGRSFKRLAAYLLHDAGKANSSERVSWAHTFNLASDDPGLAINEMLWTYRGADWLKRQAGGATGGQKLERPVKHYSLSWHPSENPSPDEMIATAEEFLRSLGAHEHQALLVGHNDKMHAHIHILLNKVHPETGRALDDSFERFAMQRWAKEYELEREHVFCQQRLNPAGDRESSPHRAMWTSFKDAEQEHDRNEELRQVRRPDYFERHDPETHQAAEWRFLRGRHEDERKEFFAGGKDAYRAVRDQVMREVRSEFKPEWREYYKARHERMDPHALSVMKADILGRQNATLKERRDEACLELREQRDQEYDQLLAQHRNERASLTECQELGLTSLYLLNGPSLQRDGQLQGQEQQTALLKDAFRSAAEEICEGAPTLAPAKESEHEQPGHRAPDEHFRIRDPANSLGDLGMGLVGAVTTLGEQLFDGFLGGADAQKKSERPNAVAGPSPTPQSAPQNSAVKMVEGAHATERQADEAKALYEYWQERRRTRERDR